MAALQTSRTALSQIAFSNDAALLVGATADAVIWLLDIGTQKPLANASLASPVKAITFGPKNNFAAILTERAGVYLLSLRMDWLGLSQP